MISKLNQLPLSLFISRLSKFDITLSLLKQEVYAIARPRYRNLPHFQKQEQKIKLIIETKSKIKILSFLRDRLRIDQVKQGNRM